MEQLPKNSQLIVVTDAIQTGGACLNFSQLDLYDMKRTYGKRRDRILACRCTLPHCRDTTFGAFLTAGK
jgi:hypothetical protein